MWLHVNPGDLTARTLGEVYNEFRDTVIAAIVRVINNAPHIANRDWFVSAAAADDDDDVVPAVLAVRVVTIAPASSANQMKNPIHTRMNAGHMVSGCPSAKQAAGTKNA